VASPPPGKSTLTVPPTMAKRDKKITESIRKEIAGDDTLSPTAKAVEVITKDRKVILKGRALNEAERMNIDSKARMTDDVVDVEDRIELVPNP
jgi:osmotically-inducible protein OsmY